MRVRKGSTGDYYRTSNMFDIDPTETYPSEDITRSHHEIQHNYNILENLHRLDSQAFGDVNKTLTILGDSTDVPTIFSRAGETLRAVDETDFVAGEKAAAEPARSERIASFIFSKRVVLALICN